MLNNNFFRLTNSQFLNTVPPTESMIELPDGTKKSTYLNASKEMCSFFKTHSAYGGSPFAAYAGIYFGKGTTPASRADIRLEEPIESGLSVETNSGFVVFGVDHMEKDFFASVRNKTDADITITEVGYVTEFYSTSSVRSLAMIDRTVLNEPITIPAGEVKGLSYSIRINFPA